MSRQTKKGSQTGRMAQYPISETILDRWSARAFSNKVVTQDELLCLFEAARWAPSSYNNQPWRFVYADRTSDSWNDFLSLLVPFNQEWAQHASALVVICSDTLFTFNQKPTRTHAFDTGAAWQNLCLQAASMGLVVHGMEGFDYDKAGQMINLPETYVIHAMCAVGWPGEKEDLSQELQKKETPSDRNPTESFVFKDLFTT